MIQEIRGLLNRLGVTANYTGYFHTSYAVLLSIEDAERLRLITKLLYPEVAKHYHTTPAAVERSIRTAAATAWGRNPELINQIARYPLVQRPTNSQFISILTSFFIYPDSVA